MPILGPDSVTAARLSLEASKLGRFANSTTPCGRRAAGPGHERDRGASGGIPPAPRTDPEIEAELKRNFQLAGQLGATGTPLFVIGDRVMNGAVGYDALERAIDVARSKKS